MGGEISRSRPEEPEPALTLHACFSGVPTARLPSALDAEPPGCDQLALFTATGMTMGSEASAACGASSAELSTGSRVPGSFTSGSPVIGSSSFSADGIDEHPAATSASPRARAGRARIVIACAAVSAAPPPR